MKYIISFLIIILFINATGCKKEGDKNLKLCLSESNSGWFYIFITREDKGVNKGECLKFDKHNVLIIPQKWVTDSTQINLFKENLNFNDSAYYFSSGEFVGENKYLYRYYSFFINDTLNNDYILSDTFKEKEYSKRSEKIENIIKHYNIR